MEWVYLDEFLEAGNYRIGLWGTSHKINRGTIRNSIDNWWCRA